MSIYGNTTNINFPNLGISFKNVPQGFTVFGFDIALYGIIIAIAMMAGIFMGCHQAKREGDDPEFYMDLALIAIPFCIIGARAYDVIFSWDQYKDDVMQIFNLRNGGLAIYGGIITALITAFFVCKIRHHSVGLALDTGILGMLVGQLIGRWGNFFNRECFGRYSDGLLAMQIDVHDSALSYIYKPDSCSDSWLASLYEGKEKAAEYIAEIRNNIVTAADGAQYIQVHPTFLYESLWNLVLVILLYIYSPHKKFDGEIVILYLFGYGLGRFWIEGLRTSPLFLWGSEIIASQALSAVIVVLAAAAYVLFLKRSKRQNKTTNN